jgi:mono/diheme cytochrome c family protein
MNPPRLRTLVVALVVALTGVAAPGARADDDPPAGPGQALYADRCASCHGARGEGNIEEYARPLAGERPLDELTRYIDKTMPPDDPGSLSADEAAAVASYVFEAFYSPAAQARNTPRLDLARLTVRQYRNALADLVGSFRNPTPPWPTEPEKRGLKAEYYQSRDFDRNDRVIERVDPEVKFDFGTDVPEPGKFKDDAFSIRWSGLVLAPETGDYDFVVHTEHALRLFVNDDRTPLIDAWVKSGTDTEFRGTIRLLAGRAYPIRLEFSKAKQGVDDSDKEKDKPKPKIPASIALAWKPPHRAEEVIPRHCLADADGPEVFVVGTPMPPDDRSIGYERGSSVSKAWAQAVTAAAIETASFVAPRLNRLAGTKDDASDRPEKLRGFARTFVERAFRRPLTDDQTALYINRPFDESPDPETAVRRVVLLALHSPRFLYREPARSADAYDVASRLSFALWDSLPDPPLLDAAAQGQLASREQVEAQARRMLNDLRTRSKVRDFLMQWLKVESIPELVKDPEAFPEFNPQVATDLRTSLDLFLADAVWGESSDFKQLYLSDAVYLNGRLAKLYGADLPDDAPFTRVERPTAERSGVITQPYLLTNFAYTASSSPIHRGVFLARGVMGRALRPPPIAVAPLAPDLHAGLTTRERVALQTSPDACMGCHEMINGLGFTLEQYDALGRFRETEKDRPVDSTGLYKTPGGDALTFHGARELAEYAADNPDSQGVFVDQLFHYLIKQPLRGYGPGASTELLDAFVKDGLNIRDLIVAIAVRAALPAPSDTMASPPPHAE